MKEKLIPYEEDIKSCPFCKNKDNSGETFYYSYGNGKGRYICTKCKSAFNIFYIVKETKIKKEKWKEEEG